VFAKILDSTHRQSNYRCIRPTSFEYNSLKHELYKQNKDVLIFSIEYLYGKKLSHSTNFRDIGATLGGLYSDFNIQDVQKLIQLYRVYSSTHHLVKEIYNKLLKIVPPQTNLKRWQKVLQD
jgi:hypothetical protein